MNINPNLAGTLQVPSRGEWFLPLVSTREPLVVTARAPFNTKIRRSTPAKTGREL